jgi:hypothetical protein
MNHRFDDRPQLPHLPASRWISFLNPEIKGQVVAWVRGRPTFAPDPLVLQNFTRSPQRLLHGRKRFFTKG